MKYRNHTIGLPSKREIDYGLFGLILILFSFSISITTGFYYLCEGTFY